MKKSGLSCSLLSANSKHSTYHKAHLIKTCLMNKTDEKWSWSSKYVATILSHVWWRKREDGICNLSISHKVLCEDFKLSQLLKGRLTHKWKRKQLSRPNNKGPQFAIVGPMVQTQVSLTKGTKLSQAPVIAWQHKPSPWTQAYLVCNTSIHLIIPVTKI